jgi:hypothetical protein
VPSAEFKKSHHLSPQIPASQYSSKPDKTKQYDDRYDNDGTTEAPITELDKFVHHWWMFKIIEQIDFLNNLTPTKPSKTITNKSL